MYPSLGELAGVDLRSYLVVRWAYFPVAMALTLWLARRRGLDRARIAGAFLIGIPAALIGGHLLNVFEAWPAYRGHPERLLDVLTGGSSIYGALGFGIGAGVLYMRWQRLPIRDVLDAAAPAMALGEATSRIGCFLAGCCFGHPTESPLGVVFPRDTPAFQWQLAAGVVEPGSAIVAPVHPTQLYAAALSGVLCLALLWLFHHRRPVSGSLCCAFLVGYGVQRLAVGRFRADAATYWWDVSNELSLVAIAAGASLWARWAWQQRQMAASTDSVSPPAAQHPGERATVACPSTHAPRVLSDVPG